ncbi:MAG: hypothetical protein ACK5LS_02645 [Propioniciclava sp.]
MHDVTSSFQRCWGQPRPSWWVMLGATWSSYAAAAGDHRQAGRSSAKVTGFLAVTALVLNAWLGRMTLSPAGEHWMSLADPRRRWRSLARMALGLVAIEAVIVGLALMFGPAVPVGLALMFAVVAGGLVVSLRPWRWQ